MRKAQTWKTKLLNKIDKLGVGRRDRYIRSIIDEDTKEALDEYKITIYYCISSFTYELHIHIRIPSEQVPDTSELLTQIFTLCWEGKLSERTLTRLEHMLNFGYGESRKEYKASGREVDDPIHSPETRRILG